MSATIPPGVVANKSRARQLIGRLLRVVRDLWTAVGIALVLLAILNFAAGRIRAHFLDTIGQEFVNRPAFVATTPPHKSRRPELAKDISVTHDSPFDAHASRWEPYVYWRSRPYAGTVVEIGPDGLRRTINAAPAPDGKPLRVFCFGGSTMWGSGVGDDGTIPSVVASTLNGQGIPVEVTNFGQPGYISTQEVITLLLEVQKENIPDLVIFYDGFNDAGAGILNREAGLAADEFNRSLEFDMFRRPKLLDLTSLYARHMPLTQLFLPGFRESLVERTTEHLAQEPLEKIAIRVAQRYLRNIQSAQALADGLGFEAIYCWQPLVATRKYPAEVEKPFLKEGMAGYHAALVDLMGQIQRQLAKQDRSVERLFVLSSIFDDPKLSGKAFFFDDCHLGESGNQIVGAQIAAIAAGPLKQRFKAKQSAVSQRLQ